MLNKAASTAVWIACAASLSARPHLAGWDDPAAYASHAGGMYFEQTPGNLEVSDFGFHALLPHGISLTENLTLQPATDFRDVGYDDLTFDLAGGAGYRFHESFSVGIGASITNLTGDVDFYPGVGFDWQAGERLRISLCGPTFAATYLPDGNWRFSIRSESTGEIWNISDDEGKSRDIDLKSYRIGIHASRRLWGQISISAGIGVVFDNEIGLNRSNGDVLIQQRLDSGFFSEVALTITEW